MTLLNAGKLLRPLILLFFSLAGVASARDMSQYPCTVFSADACFRLPTGTHADYSAPADFDFYTVSKDAETVATIYIGNAPQAAEDLASPSVSQSTDGTIKIYRDEAKPIRKLDIYIALKTADAPTIHISANLNSSTRTELMELLSSLRPCRPIKSGGQKCRINSVWSKDLTKALAL